MQNTKHNPLIHLLPSLRDVAMFMPAMFVLLRTAGASHLLEGDTGWHIRTGEWILQNGQVPYRDPFSFTRPGEPWFAWEWLWDVCFALLHQAGGMAAVVFVTLLLIGAVTTLLYREILRLNGNCLVAIVLTFLASSAASIHWWARPHVFTFLFGLLAYMLLDRAQTGSMARLWLVPLMVIPWTNFHAGFFVAILLAMAYAGGQAIEAALALTAPARKEGLRRAGIYVAVAVSCGLASLVNPYTYHLHSHIYEYLTTQWHFQNVAEFRPANFQNPAARFFEVLLYLGIASAVWHAKEKRYAYVLLIVGWSHLALFSARNIALHALFATPAIALAIRDWAKALEIAPLAAWVAAAVRWFGELAEEVGAMEGLRRIPLARVAGVGLLGFLFLQPYPPARLHARFDETYPENALAAMAKQSSERRVFTIDEWGDYLIYRDYPRTKVFVDGRSDFYKEDFGKKYLDTMNVKHGWFENLQHYRVDTVLLPVDMPLAGALKESSRWRVTYDDGVAIVFELRGKGTVSTSSVVRKGGSLRENASAIGKDGDVTPITRRKT